MASDPGSSVGNTSFVLSLIIILFFSTNSSAQDSPVGFISIDCGSIGESHDDVTKLLWVGDGEYERSGSNGHVQNMTAVNSGSYSNYNYNALQTFRYFSEKEMKSKYCYELPLTTSNISFLIRAMFLHGNASELQLPIQFDVYVKASFWMQMNFTDTDDLYQPKVQESIFFSPLGGNVTYVCLVPKQGVAFISSLELRQFDLGGLMYTPSFVDNKEFFLTNSIRARFANDAQVVLRYPDDSYDRLWAEYYYDGTTDIPRNWSRIGPEINNVPSKVMESAVLSTFDGSVFYQFDLPKAVPGSFLYCIFYFAKNSTATALQQITLDTRQFPIFNVTSTPSQQSYFHILNENPIIFVLTSPYVLNAMEFYIADNISPRTTDINHVSVVNFIKETLNMAIWQGDPCTPTPYNWIDCQQIYSEFHGLSLMVHSLTLSHLKNVSGLAMLGTSEAWFGANFADEGLNYMSITHSNVDSSVFKSLLQTFVQPAWLISLNMSYNDITVFPDSQWWLDTVNNSIGVPHNLTSLDLSYNKLTQIPCFSKIPYFNHLQTLNLSNNMIIGEFPDTECFSNLPSLKVLILSNNFLRGEIPSSLSIQNLPNLTVLDISKNNFSGQLPSIFYIANGTNAFESLNVSFNQISVYPEWWSTLANNINSDGLPKHLASLDLSHNNFTQVPCFGNTSYFNTLHSLNLSSNMITGIFPDTNCFSHLPLLSVLFLSNNYFWGRIPSSLSIQNFPSLQMLDISNNKFSGQLPSSFYFAEGNSTFELLNADNNDLYGSLDLNQWFINLQALSESICTIRNSMTYHRVFSLINNEITGIQPDTEKFQSLMPSLVQQEDFNQSGVLLGGNPYCNHQKDFAQRYFCRLSLSEIVHDYPEVKRKTRSKNAIIIGSALGGGLILLFFVSLTFVIWRLSRKVFFLKLVEQELANRRVQPPFYSYADLKRATQNFHNSNLLGKGGFGVVYKGMLSDHTPLAVKRLFNDNKKRVLNEFLNEVVLLTGIKHKNLAQLKGCCIENGERILVYAFAENGNLEDALKGEASETVLSWKQRYHICVGVATGLRYLHEELQPGIIHRDVKPANILLDEKYNPRIADFGLAKGFLEDDDEHVTQMIRGTRGYFAPEYVAQGILTTKADVFSFGVVMLEIVSGRRWLHPHASTTEEIQLVPWALELQRSGSALKLLDPNLQQSEYSASEVVKLINIALMCVETDADLRPAMSKIEAMLLEDESTMYETLSSAFLNRGRKHSDMVKIWKNLVDERSGAASSSAFGKLSLVLEESSAFETSSVVSEESPLLVGSMDEHRNL